jgi:hypothetical protein
MKKIVTIGLAVCFLITLTATAFLSVSIAKDEKPAKPTAAEQKAATAKADAALLRREAETKARARLNAKEWVIQLKSSGGKKTKVETDTLTFSDGKITSKNLSDKGYPTSNYSLTLGNDSMIIWETMQTAESQDVAFWRGELQGEVMTGVLSLHPTKGEVEDFYFTTQVTEQAVQPQIAEPEKPEPQKKAEEPKKKKTKSEKK